MSLAPVLVLGARSDIGRAIARRYAAAGYPLVLAARRAPTLEPDRIDLELRYNIRAETVEFDVNGAEPDRFFAGLPAPPGTVIMVVGDNGDQARGETDDALAEQVMQTNYLGPARFLQAAARAMAATGGCIIGISSVAGDRGRKANYIYGSAKAGLTAFLSGLRGRLHGRVHVITVKPGYVATRMTAGMTLPAKLTAQPGEVARAVFDAQAKGRDVIYVRPIWRLVMFVIAAIPERLFKRMSI